MWKKQTTPEQIKAMVDFMIKHPDIGRGVTDLKAEDQNDLWDEISRKLNSMGPPIKDVPAWKKVCRDYKANIKKKLVVNKQQMEGTGGGPNKLIPLSDMEEAVSTLLNFKKSLEGIRNGLTFGIENIPSSPTESIIEDPNDEEKEPKSKRKFITYMMCNNLILLHTFYHPSQIHPGS